MLAMDKAYGELKEKGTDLGVCEEKTIEDVFHKVGLGSALEWDRKIAEFSEEEVQHIMTGAQ